ncbi:hypothetical protein KAH94_05370 [bacterium]|nr:hypothetical protein [bacterium]
MENNDIELPKEEVDDVKALEIELVETDKLIEENDKELEALEEKLSKIEEKKKKLEEKLAELEGEEIKIESPEIVEIKEEISEEPKGPEVTETPILEETIPEEIIENIPEEIIPEEITYKNVDFDLDTISPEDMDIVKKQLIQKVLDKNPELKNAKYIRNIQDALRVLKGSEELTECENKFLPMLLVDSVKCKSLLRQIILDHPIFDAEDKKAKNVKSTMTTL